MNYEKAYKEALERAKYLKENTDSVGAKDISYTFEYIFPELRESEDERIRKEIIELVQFYYGSSLGRKHTVSKDDMIAWLEKQQDIIDLEEYAKGILKGAAIHLMIWIDENLADGKMCLSNMECEDLEDAMVNAKWDKIYKYIKKKIEKQDEQSVWSEEDEKKIMWLVRLISTAGFRELDNDKMPCSKGELIDWLKFLKPNNWKPSKEQMEAIKYFIDFHRSQANASTEGWKEFKHLESLINDLKNL